MLPSTLASQVNAASVPAQTELRLTDPKKISYNHLSNQSYPSSSHDGVVLLLRQAQSALILPLL
jgi:hypothetical protein